MNRRAWTLVCVVVSLAAVLLMAMPVAAQGPAEFPRNNMAPPGPDPMDGTYMLGEKEVALRKYAAQVGPAVATGASPVGLPATIGEEITVAVSDMGASVDYNETFVVVMDGVHGIILIEKAAYAAYDADTDEYVFPNPNGCWRNEDRISTAQLEYLLDQFDTVIYPTDTAMFGEPLPRGDEGQKVWILVHNIRDESYYDCEQTSYVAGYFSSSEDAVNNKNMMHIDTYDWANRIGGDSARPYLYEGVFAHEFEHLIHFDQDPDEESWVDEGLADMAGFFCGYGHSSGHIAYYMIYHPITSLTFWGGGLESYGASYLFQLYLYEKYGGAAFSSALVQEQADGIEGIQNVLDAQGAGVTFSEVFDHWTIANYLDDTRVNPLYGYDTLEVGSEDTWGYSIEYALANFWVEDPLQVPVGLDSESWFGDPMPYTAQYFRFGGQPTLATAFDGDDNAGVPAYSGTYEWYSGMEIWGWRSFYQSFVIPEAGATLNFMTYYDIEENWDYGYVEVYDQDTKEWYTLPDLNGMTITDVAFAQDNPNCPAGREPTDYQTAGRWHAFTGSSGGWIPVSMDLSPFAGHTIDLYFTTWQDGAFTLQMMYVDDISISKIPFSDGAEAGEDGWTPTGWYITTGILANNWQATLIESLWQPTDRYPVAESWHARKLLDETHMEMDAATQSGEITGINATPAKARRAQVLIVSNRAEHIMSSGYSVQFTN